MADLTPERKLLDLITKAQGKLRLRKELKIFTKLNIVLIGLIIVILAVFLVDIFTSDHTIPELTVHLPEQKEDVLLKLPEFDEGIEDVEVVVEKDVSLSKEYAVKNLNLLGIITADSNQAIIEDKESKKTFFLYKGDGFGEFKVYDIKDNGVVLEHRGEKIELKM